MEVPLAAITEALGMSTAAWLELPVELVDPATLTPTQAVGDLRGRLSSACGDPCVHVVELAGVSYVEDGHHRLARAVRDGQSVIAARVLRCTIRGVAA